MVNYLSVWIELRKSLRKMFTVSTVYHAVGTHGICLLAAQVVDSD